MNGWRDLVWAVGSVPHTKYGFRVWQGRHKRYRRSCGTRRHAMAVWEIKTQK